MYGCEKQDRMMVLKHADMLRPLSNDMDKEQDIVEVEVPIAYITTQGILSRRDVD